MPQKRLVILLTWMMCILVIQIKAQTSSIHLWDDKIPGERPHDPYTPKVDSADNWIKMRYVQNPMLDVFLPEKPTGTAVIICPGGAYWGLAIDHEGKQVAQWLNTFGITAFVLKYRLPDNAIMLDKSVAPLQDGLEAVRAVRRRAKAWGIAPNKIGMMGFSAGGHLASTVATHFNEKNTTSPDSVSARPDFSILIYPVISMLRGITHQGSRINLLGEKPSTKTIHYFSNELQVNADTPPAFLVHSIDDDAVPVQNSIQYALSMQKNKVPCELHIYESGGHGYGLGKGDNTASNWPMACIKWLKYRGLM